MPKKWPTLFDRLLVGGMGLGFAAVVYTLLSMPTQVPKATIAFVDGDKAALKITADYSLNDRTAPQNAANHNDSPALESWWNKVETIGLALINQIGNQDKDQVANDKLLSLSPSEPLYERLYAASSRGLERIFRQHNYSLLKVRNGQSEVPRIVVAALPHDLAVLADNQERKRMFIKSLLPMVLLINEEIETERAQLLALHQRRNQLSAVERNFVKKMAQKWNFNDDENPSLTQILERVDTIPVSIVLAQAAIESGWGSSRFAREGNALFGQWTYDDKQVSALVPQNIDDGASNRIRAFKEPLAAVRSYMRNINTHFAYDDLRKERARLRKQATPLTTALLVEHLESYSEQGRDYIALIEKVIDSNDLEYLDRAKLAGTPKMSDKLAELEPATNHNLGKPVIFQD